MTDNSANYYDEDANTNNGSREFLSASASGTPRLRASRPFTVHDIGTASPTPSSNRRSNIENDDDDDDDDEEGGNAYLQELNHRRPKSNGDLVLSDEMTVRDRQHAINMSHPFGVRLWKPALYKKKRTIENISYLDLHEIPNGSRAKTEWHVSGGNILWFLLFGWWIGAIYFATALVVLLFTFPTVDGRRYTYLLLSMGKYISWPFGRYLKRIHYGIYEYDIGEEPLLPRSEQSESPQAEVTKKQFIMAVIKNCIASIRKCSYADFCYYAVFFSIIAPVHLLVSVVCWLLVVSIPMAKLNSSLVQHLYQIPLKLHVSSLTFSNSIVDSGDILLCTFKAIGWRYYKYTYDGINVIFINLLAVVAFAMVYCYYPTDYKKDEVFTFILCIISTIPLSYFIGMAVASISSQSSFGLGAVINASFGSIVEIILYCIAINSKEGTLVEGALVGSFLGVLLLLPGLSMIAGGVGKWKEQRFNVKSAGVSTVLLIMALIGAFTPTLFYSLFGSYELTCQECTSDAATSDHLTAASAAVACRLCHYELPKRPESDPFYLKNTRPLMYFCASILPLAYLIGLLFTLRTHVKQIYYSDHKKHDSALLAPAHSDHNNGLAEGSSNTEENTETRDNTPLEDKLQDAQHAHVGGGHDSPEWSKMKSVVILLTCTVLFALLAEQLVQNSKSTADALGISDKFMGLTIFAIVPSFTEFLNAVMFAMYGNIALSLEIGSAYAVQVAMIQIPCVVAYSAWNNFIQGIPDTAETAFTLIFPRWDLYTNFFAVFLLSYTYIEGKANYFKGSILTLTYLLLLISFYYAEP